MIPTQTLWVTGGETTACEVSAIGLVSQSTRHPYTDALGNRRRDWASVVSAIKIQESEPQTVA